jgi:hypothetical protein
MAFVAGLRVDLGDAEGEEGERKEFEGVFGGGAVVDFGEEGVLGASFLVGGGLEGSDCAFDCSSLVSTYCETKDKAVLPLNIFLRFSS